MPERDHHRDQPPAHAKPGSSDTARAVPFGNAAPALVITKILSIHLVGKCIHIELDVELVRSS